MMYNTIWCVVSRVYVECRVPSLEMVAVSIRIYSHLHSALYAQCLCNDSILSLSSLLTHAHAFKFKKQLLGIVTWATGAGGAYLLLKK